MENNEVQQTMNIDEYFEPLPQIKDPVIIEKTNKKSAPEPVNKEQNEENNNEELFLNENKQKLQNSRENTAGPDEFRPPVHNKIMSVLNKPEILLETPYMVITNKGQHMRYRLEFGYPDQAIPEGEKSIMDNTEPPIEIKKLPDNQELLESKNAIEKKEKKKYFKSELWDWTKAIGIAVIIAFLIRFFVFVMVSVDGWSMKPTLADKDYLFVTKYDYLLGKPKTQDIIICKYPNDPKNENYVKRVIGTPGDTVEIKEGIVFINGTALDEPYIEYHKKDNISAFVVPEKKYFVMGDNRADSKDSRYPSVGCIDENKIIGHARFNVLPFNKMFHTLD